MYTPNKFENRFTHYNAESTMCTCDSVLVFLYGKWPVKPTMLAEWANDNTRFFLEGRNSLIQTDPVTDGTTTLLFHRTKRVTRVVNDYLPTISTGFDPIKSQGSRFFSHEVVICTDSNNHRLPIRCQTFIYETVVISEIHFESLYIYVYQTWISVSRVGQFTPNINKLLKCVPGKATP